LHTLLRLQMQWIEGESGNIDDLTEERLSLYNGVLAGQVEGLEKRLQDMVFHPRYRPIFVWNNRRAETIDGPDKMRELDDSITSIERAVRLIAEAKTSDNVRAAIAPLRSAPSFS